jgi:hypothetical protein
LVLDREEVLEAIALRLTEEIEGIGRAGPERKARVGAAGELLARAYTQGASFGVSEGQGQGFEVPGLRGAGSGRAKMYELIVPYVPWHTDERGRSVDDSREPRLVTQ